MDPAVANGAGTIGAAYRHNYAKFQFGKAGATKLVILVGTSSGNINVGVLSNTGSGSLAKPGAIKREVGSIPCPASGKAEITVASTDIDVADWADLTCDNTTATFLRVAGNNNAQNEGRSCYYTGASLAIPVAVTPTGGISTTYLVRGE